MSEDHYATYTPTAPSTVEETAAARYLFKPGVSRRFEEIDPAVRGVRVTAVFLVYLVLGWVWCVAFALLGVEFLAAYAHVVFGIVADPMNATVLGSPFRDPGLITGMSYPMATTGFVVMLMWNGGPACLRWLRKHDPLSKHRRPVDPPAWAAVDLDAEVSGTHRETLTALKDRATDCRTVQRQLWDLAVAARAHRRLSLDTIARPKLTVSVDPRPEVLARLEREFSLHAAILDTALTRAGKTSDACVCRGAESSDAVGGHTAPGLHAASAAANDLCASDPLAGVRGRWS